MSDILALSVPPLQLPQTIVLPKTPTGGSPGALILTVFAAGLDTLAQYSASKIIPKPKTEQELEDDRRSDNKHVVKMSDCAQVIDTYLNAALNVGLIGRTAAKMFTGKPAKKWDPYTELSQDISDAAWMTIRETLKKKIREKLLQQKNARSSVTESSFIRLGELHR
jgi:putative N-acetylmannosamine-6-phosphate epimerase